MDLVPVVWIPPPWVPVAELWVEKKLFNLEVFAGQFPPRGVAQSLCVHTGQQSTVHVFDTPRASLEEVMHGPKVCAKTEHPLFSRATRQLPFRNPGVPNALSWPTFVRFKGQKRRVKRCFIQKKRWFHCAIFYPSISFCLTWVTGAAVLVKQPDLSPFKQ